MIRYLTIDFDAIYDGGFNIDITDAAIFEYIVKFSHSSICVKVNTPEGVYFKISPQLIINSLPILGIKTKRGINKRTENLIKEGLIEKHPNCRELNSSLIRFGKRYNDMVFRDTSEQMDLAPRYKRSYDLGTTVPTNIENTNIENINKQVLCEKISHDSLSEKNQDKKKYIEDQFEELWNIIPSDRKKEKKTAKDKYYQKVVKLAKEKKSISSACTYLLEGWKKYDLELKLKKKVGMFSPEMKLLSTWLNKECYNDFYVTNEVELLKIKDNSTKGLKSGLSNVLLTKRQREGVE
jgi:hypothetical protein